MKIISEALIPLLVIGIIIYAYRRKIDIYSSFVEGAKSGLSTTLNIFPTLLAMVFAINIFLKSGVVDFIFAWTKPLLSSFNLPLEILPMAFLRPISGSASLAILNDIFISFGPDSFVGRLASTIQGCTDTTIYVLALYFGSVKITKTKYALKVGLIADLVGIVVSFVVVSWFFN